MVGKVQSRVKDVAEAKGLRTPYELQMKANLVPSMAARLWRGDVTRFSKDTLAKLCSALNCKVGDLLVYEKRAA